MKVVTKAFSFLHDRKKAYQLCFSSPAGQEVLMDLVKFCRGEQTCFDPDPRIHAALEGRREVWLRITQHLNLTTQDLYDLYGGRSVPVKQEEDNDGR